FNARLRMRVPLRARSGRGMMLRKSFWSKPSRSVQWHSSASRPTCTEPQAEQNSPMRYEPLALSLVLACFCGRPAIAQVEAAPASTRETTATAEGEAARQKPDYALPALEILGFDFLLNRINRNIGNNRQDYAVRLESIRRNLHSSWG